ncbi:LLM class flavin-dependent oxidoreductase [Arthrobacter alpinus]|nr:LLM class flavin-dependent oxidoreductase [Arthrobacter alpinus]
MIALAQLADRRGFQRFWMSEHHAMPGAATPSPQLMVARLIGETERIRLGAGGIMLPNHVPLVCQGPWVSAHQRSGFLPAGGQQSARIWP